MAEQKLPLGTDTPLQVLIHQQSGVIDRELYDNIHRRKTEKGKREGAIFSLKTDKILWAASADDDMDLLALNRKSKICTFSHQRASILTLLPRLVARISSCS